MRRLLASLEPESTRFLRRLLLGGGWRYRWSLLRTFARRLVGLRESDRLASDLTPDARALFICRGNLFRSPMGEALFARSVARHGTSRFQVHSAGLRAHPGLPAPDAAQEAARALGVDLAKHRTQRLTTELIAASDVVIVMDLENEAEILERFPECGDRLVLLGAFDPQAEALGPTIADPYGQPVDEVRTCYERVERSVEGLHAAMAEAAALRRERTLIAPRQFLRSTLTSRPLLPLWKRFSDSVVTVFMLHRFGDPRLGVRGHDPQVLDRGLSALRREGFHPIGLDEWVAAVHEGRPLPPRAVAFTVDDGYADFHAIGWPVFERHGVPVTCFLVSDPLDRRGWFWWDRIHYAFETTRRHELALDTGRELWRFAWSRPQQRRQVERRLVHSLRLLPEGEKLPLLARLAETLEVDVPALPPDRFAAMTWDQVRDAYRRGATFGGHTLSHPRLSTCSEDAGRRELTVSVARVREEVGAVVPLFCYPYGDPGAFGPREERLVAEAGLAGAFSTTPGFATPAAWSPAEPSRFRIPRYALPDSARQMLKIACGLERLLAEARATAGRDPGGTDRIAAT